MTARCEKDTSEFGVPSVPNISRVAIYIQISDLRKSSKKY